MMKKNEITASVSFSPSNAEGKRIGQLAAHADEAFKNGQLKSFKGLSREQRLAILRGDA